MRWVTYVSRSGRSAIERVGLVVDDEVRGLELGVQLVDLFGDDGQLLSDSAERARRSPAEVLPLGDAQLRPPIPRPPSVRDFFAFEDHFLAGVKAIGQEPSPEWYEAPVFYFSNPNAMVGDGEEVVFPGQSNRMDYELEVAAIVGEGGADLEPSSAEAHIAGFCIFNDWSARDLQRSEIRAAPIGPGKGKDFASTLGPFLVTPDELEPFRAGNAFDLQMTASVNGREYSRGNLATMYWTLGELLVYVSRSTMLVPGDVIGTGTCSSGCILEQAMAHGTDQYPWLEDGDEVVLQVERLGHITNRVRRGARPEPLR